MAGRHALIVSDEGKFFPTSPSSSLSSVEDFLKFLQEHKKPLKLGQNI